MSSELLCPRCAKYEHPHLDKVLKLRDFIAKMSKRIEEAKGAIRKDSCHLDFLSIVKNKKHEIEAMQLEILEMVVRQLSEEKKKLFGALEAI